MTATITRTEAHEATISDLEAQALWHEAHAIECRTVIASLRRVLGYQEELADEDSVPTPDVIPAESKETGRENAGAAQDVITPSRDDIPAIPRPKGAEEAVMVPEIDTSKPKTKKELVVQCHKEHPDWWANKIAEHLGINVSTVTGYASTLGLKLARNPNVGGGALARGAKPQEARKSEPALEAPAKPEPAPAAPVEDGEALLERARAVTQPAGTKFRLKHPESGHYLHESLTRDGNKALQVTANKQFAWCQPEARLLKVRQLHPETAGWGEEVVLP